MVMMLSCSTSFPTSANAESTGLRDLPISLLAKIANDLPAARDRVSFVSVLHGDARLLQSPAARLDFLSALSSSAARRELALGDSSELVQSHLLSAHDRARVALSHELRMTLPSAKEWHPLQPLYEVPLRARCTRRAHQSVSTSLLFIRAATTAPTAEERSIALSLLARNIRKDSQQNQPRVLRALTKAAQGAPQVLQELADAAPSVAKTYRPVLLGEILDAANGHPYVVARVETQARKLSTCDKGLVLERLRLLRTSPARLR